MSGKTAKDLRTITGLKDDVAVLLFQQYGNYEGALASFAQSYDQLPGTLFADPNVKTAALDIDRINVELRQIYARAIELKAQHKCDDSAVWAHFTQPASSSAVIDSTSAPASGTAAPASGASKPAATDASKPATSAFGSAFGAAAPASGASKPAAADASKPATSAFGSAFGAAAPASGAGFGSGTPAATVSGFGAQAFQSSAGFGSSNTANDKGFKVGQQAFGSTTSVFAQSSTAEAPAPSGGFKSAFPSSTFKSAFGVAPGGGPGATPFKSAFS